MKEKFPEEGRREARLLTSYIISIRHDYCVNITYNSVLEDFQRYYVQHLQPPILCLFASRLTGIVTGPL